jgi:nucleoid-associated protein YgaU
MPKLTVTTVAAKPPQQRRRVVISCPSQSLTLPITSARVEYRDLGTRQWKELPRTQDVPLLRYSGISRMQVQLTATLFQVGKVTPEAQIRALRKIARQAQPVAVAYGDILGSGKWIIPSSPAVTSTQLWPGTNLIRHADVTIQLTEWLNERLTKPSTAKRRPKNARRKTPLIYIVKKGDTLSTIAANPKVCGDASHASIIARDNKIRDPRKLRVGQRLTIRC